jgi:hypothetical protein
MAAAILGALLTTTCAPGARGPFNAPLTLTAQGGSRPTTAIDPRDGTIYVAWVGTRDGSADVYLARLDPGAREPAPPVRVNHLPGDAAPHDQAPARVAVGSDGTVYLAWQNNRHIPGRRFPASDLRFARSTDRGMNFESAVQINLDAGGTHASHTFHDLAVARGGTILVSWIQSGEIHLAASRDGGHSFTPSQLVDHGACPCCRTALALAPDGTTFLAWRKILGEDIRDIVVARVDAPEIEPTGMKAATGPVHPPVRAHHDDWQLDACPHAGPALLADAGGKVHLAWYTGRAGGAGLYYSASADRGATFAPPTPVLTGHAIPPSQISLATTATGGVMIAWEDRREPERRIHLARLGGRRILTLTGATPALAHAAGTTALAWLEGESVHLVVAR